MPRNIYEDLASSIEIRLNITYPNIQEKQNFIRVCEVLGFQGSSKKYIFCFLEVQIMRISKTFENVPTTNEKYFLVMKL